MLGFSKENIEDDCYWCKYKDICSLILMEIDKTYDIVKLMDKKEIIK